MGNTEVSVPADARDRLVRGLEKSIEVKGYRNTTIADIVRNAKASRRTFYRIFTTKDEVLFALIDTVDDVVIRDMEAAVDPMLSWKEQVAGAIRIYFDHIERRPAVHLCAIRELPYLGEAAEPVMRRGHEAFVSLIYKMTDNEEFRRAGLAPASRLHAMMVQGALNELVAEILQSGGSISEGLDLAIGSTAALLSVDPDRGWDPRA